MTGWCPLAAPPWTLLPASSSSAAGDSLGRNQTLSSARVVPKVSPNVPSYSRLIVFFLSTTLIWLSEPLLSLVDTTVVGWIPPSASRAVAAASVEQLASLGPATTLCDSLLYLTYFLAIATTNKLAPDLARRRYRRLQTTTSHVLGVAGVLGVAMTALIWTVGRPLLTWMAGASATPNLIAYATKYASIRASVGTLAIMGMVAQSFCLVNLDTTTPTLAVLVASIVNITGDLLLRRWGVVGAATATAAASVLSASVLLAAVRRQMVAWRRLEEAEAIETQPPPPPVPMVSLPDRPAMVQLIQLAGPIFLVILAKIACYSAMTLRVTDFGVLSLAAHNIMMRCFFFFGTFGDALSQTAQSFMPATLYPVTSPRDYRAVLRKLLVVTSVVACINSQVVRLILQRFGRYLASDTSIVALFAEHSKFIGLSVLLHPFSLVFEGSVIAARDFRSLLRTYAMTLVLHFGILRFYAGSFAAVWRTFFLFQSIRLGNFGWRVLTRQWQAHRAERRDRV